MNIYKKQDIVSFIRKQGKLPTDQFGQILPVNDLLLWFELDKCLTRLEQEMIKKELAAMAEAQEALEKLRIIERSGTNLSS
ncbi:MAG: hypothetical protein WC765_03425 [Phycisphaerae bacterium]|jgi:hypothetical protein